MAWVDRIPLVTPHSAGAVDEASRGSRRKLRQDSSHRQRTPPPRLATDLSQLGARARGAETVPAGGATANALAPTATAAVPVLAEQRQRESGGAAAGSDSVGC